MKQLIRPRKTSLPDYLAVGDAEGPLVTVVIPTRNRPHLLENAVRSVLAQTVTEVEVIVVDDASSRPPDAVVGKFGDPRVQLVSRRNSGGPGAARNTGIEAARGEWLAFVDDDDEWLPEKLELQLARLAEAPEASAVYCLCSVATPSAVMAPRYKPPLPEGNVVASVLLDTHPLTPCAYMVRRTALLNVGGFDETYPAASDADLWVRFSLAGYLTCAVPQVLVVQHAEHKRRITQDPVLLTLGYARLASQWRGVARSSLSAGDLSRIKPRMREELEPLHERHVKRLVRKGRRKKAWRYVRSMVQTLPVFPWVGPNLLRALPVVVLGERATQLPGMPKRKRGTEPDSTTQSNALDKAT